MSDTISIHCVIQCCCKILFPYSGKVDLLLYSSAVIAALACLPMRQRLYCVSPTLCIALVSGDLWTLYFCAASAGVVSVHLGGLGIASVSLYSTLFYR